MTQSSRPFDGQTAGDQGPYSDRDWREVWKAAANGVYADEGVVRKGSTANPITGLQVSAGAGLSVDISAGYAFPVGWYYQNTATVNLTLVSNNTEFSRIDLIVLRATWGETQQVRLARKIGSPAAVPVAPSLTQIDGTTYEIPLAEVTVGSGATSIAASDILDARRFLAPDCFYFRQYRGRSFSSTTPIDFSTNDGTPMSFTITGDPSPNNFGVSAALSSSAILLIGYATSADKICGVSVIPTAHTDLTPIIAHGLARVYLRDTVAAGDHLSVQLNEARSDDPGCKPGNYYPVGVALEDGIAGDRILTHVACGTGASYKPRAAFRQEYAQNTAGPALTASTWVTRQLNTSVIAELQIVSLDTVTNRITLAPGRYLVKWWAVGHGVNSHQTRLRDVTSGTTLVEGTTAYAANASGHVTVSRGLSTFLTATSLRQVELQHWVQTTNASGQGRAANLTTEVYAYIEFIKIGDN